jgi:protein ImuB
MTVACVLIPRFPLRAAAGSAWQPEVPAALAPLPGGRQAVGEVSSQAETSGVHAGMALGEALARCPALRLVPPDPARAAETWEAVCGRLEGMGAAIEVSRQGEAFFAVDGLCGLYGGAASGVLAAARDSAGVPVRVAAAPSRFAAALAAERGRQLPRPVGQDGTEAILSERSLKRFLHPRPVSALRSRLDGGSPEEGNLIEALRRLGISTLGHLAMLTGDQLADRFGRLGVRALRLARGEDEPLRPRSPREELSVEIELPEGTAGLQLDHALGLLVDRLLAEPARSERTLLVLRLSAPLCGGGSWSVEQGIGRPSASPQVIRPLLARRLEELPGPVAALRLRALAFGPRASDQLELDLDGAPSRWRRVGAAIREVRAASGPEALLRVVEVEPHSRVPERRFLLSPHPQR